MQGQGSSMFFCCLCQTELELVGHCLMWIFACAQRDAMGGVQGGADTVILCFPRCTQPCEPSPPKWRVALGACERVLLVYMRACDTCIRARFMTSDALSFDETLTV